MNPDTPQLNSQPPPSPLADQPVAYDANGQPLYARPQVVQAPEEEAYYRKTTGISSHVTSAPQVIEGANHDPHIRMQYANEPRVVHTTRELDPRPFEISEETAKLHEESKRLYPHLNLSEGEFVILDIRRHPIGMLMPLGAAGVVLVAFLAGMVIYPVDAEASGLPRFEVAMLIMVLIMALVLMGTFIALWVYLQNRFILTNESVIQEIQNSLFSRHEQMVSLGSIEDASCKVNGVLQTVLNYGTIRLSTEGDETTYRFSYVSEPVNQISTVNNAIEAFKNGRPVEHPDAAQSRARDDDMN